MPVKDTVGCGDSFAAAIVLGYIRGHDLPAVLALANAVGAATAMGTGAGRNVASADMVMSLLRREADARAVSIDTGTTNLGETKRGLSASLSNGSSREQMLILGTDVALGDRLTISEAAREVAATVDAISVLQMSLDEVDSE